MSASETFWRRVDRNGPPHPYTPELGCCWLWMGPTRGRGYGGCTFDGEDAYAHRIAWRLTHGDPDRVAVLHSCDRRLCVNPAHLFIGTHADNSADMVAKGRSAIGERAPSAKMTAEGVREFRRRFAAGEPQRALAREYGIGINQANRIVRRLDWRHVD